MENKICGKPAAYLYTWPGKDQAGICSDHVGMLRMVAGAIGMHLQLIPAPEGSTETCNQQVSVKEGEG